MLTLPDIAQAHLDQRKQLADRATTKALRLYRHMDLNDLDGSWDAIGPELTATVAAAQVTAAAQATGYVNAVAPEPGAPNIQPRAFSDVTVDGRELGPALYGSVTTTKSFIGRGMLPERAFQAGAVFLSIVANSAILDMGRQADLTAGIAHKRTYYVRALQPGACSRCAILAGKHSSKTAFKRHPRCRCVAVPVQSGESPEGFPADPQSYFDELDKSEQDRIFTKAGAEAIRQGADPTKVVNARRGAYGIGYSGHYNPPSVTRGSLVPVQIGHRSDGSPLLVYATSEGSTRYGAYGRTSRSVRLLPEQIAVMAGGNTDRWIELLGRYGYL